MAQVFTQSRRVQWHETDAAVSAHFTAFLKYMAETEHALLRDRGLDVHLEDELGKMSFPRVSVDCDFRASLRFNDVCDVRAHVKRLGEKSITYAFEFDKQGTVIATGHITAVCCRIHADRPPEPIAVPDWFREKLDFPSGERTE